MSSIHARLLLVSSLVLAGFLGITGWALETAFRDSTETALEEKLQSYVYGLLAAADVDSRGQMQLPEHLPEPRFSRPDSGLYAFVVTDEGKQFWRSPSSVGIATPEIHQQQSGQRLFEQRTDLFLLLHGVEWEDDSGITQHFTFAVAEQVQPFEQQITQFRTSLWSWLGGMALVLLIVQGIILRWGLRPLRQVELDLKRIRKGEVDTLAGSYPRELQGLTSSLNALMMHGKSVQERYRTTLDDLAHSLKTPLAYLKTLLQDQTVSSERMRGVTEEQLDRMDHIVQHQLRRAAVSARSTLMAPVSVAPIVERLLVTLEKIYAEKNMSVVRKLDEAAIFHGDEADLMEVLGNLLENAFKYGRSKVQVTARMNKGLELQIEDDGADISSSLWKSVLERGSRADELNSGQGIGLTVANEIVSLYHGDLGRETSDMGGLKLQIKFPEHDQS